jgi:hypothetical protein
MQRLTLVVALSLITTSALAAECVPPMDRDQPMLTLVKTLSEGRSRTLEIDPDGRASVLTSEKREETWIDFSQVEEILLSIVPILPMSAPTGAPTTTPQGGKRWFSLSCFDLEANETRRVHTEVNSSSDLSQELNALDYWVTYRIKTEAHQPFWVSGPPCPLICQPDNRRNAGLGVERPFWCEGRVLAQPEADQLFGCGNLFGANLGKRTRDQIREQLRERLKNLPRGLQDGTDRDADLEDPADSHPGGVDLAPSAVSLDDPGPVPAALPRCLGDVDS